LEPIWEKKRKMLRLEHVTTQYDDSVIVLRDISLRVKRGEIVCILGSNGAGKTTLLKTITHLLKPLRGQIYFEDKRIDQLKTHQVISLGISVVPEGRRLFPEFTVYENMRVGAYSEKNLSVVEKRMDELFGIFPVLRERQHQLAGTLSGGEQGMLTMGRALMAAPRMLLLDEPSLGLAPIMVKELFKVVKRVNEGGVTILLIEQNANKSLSIASRGYVLQKGAIVVEGTKEELKRSEALQLAYLKG
jgi:branched-chain amino acid transport system ATP-binding protein